MDATYGSRAMLGYPYMTSMYPTGHSSMVLDPFMMPMHPTGHSSMALHPYMTVNVPHRTLQHSPGPLHDVNVIFCLCTPKNYL
jgi:hypothetical protein